MSESTTNRHALGLLLDQPANSTVDVPTTTTEALASVEGAPQQTPPKLEDLLNGALESYKRMGKAQNNL